MQEILFRVPRIYYLLTAPSSPSPSLTLWRTGKDQEHGWYKNWCTRGIFSLKSRKMHKKFKNWAYFFVPLESFIILHVKTYWNLGSNKICCPHKKKLTFQHNILVQWRCQEFRFPAAVREYELALLPPNPRVGEKTGREEAAEIEP